MEAYLTDWLNLLARWLHMIAGIAWIGSSFYFIWLDDHLQIAGRPRADRRQGCRRGSLVGARRRFLPCAENTKRRAKGDSRAPLHWFKWEAYTTWLSSGIFLLVHSFTGYGAERLSH